MSRLRRLFAPRRLRTIGLLALVALSASACASPDVQVQVGDGDPASGGGAFSLSVQLIVALTVLSVAPSILLMATSFTRILVVFGLVRNAIGIPSLPPNQVLIGLSLFLTLFVMRPTITTIVDTAYDPYTRGEISAEVALDRGVDAFRDFMGARVGERELDAFVDLSGQTPAPTSIDEVPTETLVPAFVVSELTRAFAIGFLLYIPFLIIDLVVAAALMALGMVMVSPIQIALPFKLLLFVMVDGWMLLSDTLVRSFGT
jgi:flagellar biosynthetic protein FliP